MQLIWVPGHMGIHGNEMADALAREGSETQLIGPEPFVALAPSTINKALKDYIEIRHGIEWKEQPGMKHSKSFLGGNALGKSKFICGGSRRQARLTIGALTGHYATNQMLHRMHLSTNSLCRACGEETESMQHLLCDCDSLARKRMGLLGSAYPKPEDFRLFALKDVAKLMASIFKEEEE